MEKKTAIINKKAEEAKKQMLKSQAAGEAAFQEIIDQYGNDGWVLYIRGSAYEEISKSGSLSVDEEIGLLEKAAADYKRAAEILPGKKFVDMANAAYQSVLSKIAALEEIKPPPPLDGPTMYPERLDPATKSGAERRLYIGLRAALDKGYTVFHHVAWQALGKGKNPVDGEADFVIAHPKHGILLVEVKGGGIAFDAVTGKVTSTDGLGQCHVIKDPFDQAQNNSYRLKDLLAAHTPGPLKIGHAVAFPDSTVGATPLGLDCPKQIVCGQEDMANLAVWVGKALTYYQGLHPTAPGEATIKALTEQLARSWELHPVLGSALAEESSYRITLTRQQYTLLDVLARQTRATICGCAGSGKTLLATEKAVRLARQGFRVLLTCFNGTLAADLRLRLKDRPATLDIMNFRGVCHHFGEKTGVIPPGVGEDDFVGDWAETLMQAIGKMDFRYDAIVVDEGQDFKDDWWIPLQSLLTHPDKGTLYIFYDDNQNVFVKKSHFPITTDSYVLSTNCRNTQAIYNVVVQFYEGDTAPVAHGPRGEPVEVVEYQPGQMMAALEARLSLLINDEKVKSEQIAVLTPLGVANSTLFTAGQAQGPLLTKTFPAAPGRIFCTPVAAFKGLERDVIILTELEHLDVCKASSVLYVGCSRACGRLIALLPHGKRSDLRAYLAAGQVKP